MYKSVISWLLRGLLSHTECNDVSMTIQELKKKCSIKFDDRIIAHIKHENWKKHNCFINKQISIIIMKVHLKKQVICS